MDKLTLLKVLFGHDGFREGQEPLVDALLSGRDVLGVMPTGAGKSICYQLPAMGLPGFALVVSPLISLMKDQVAALVHSGVPAAYINSSLTPAQQREVLQRADTGAYKLIYVAPERLMAPDFLRLAQKGGVSLVAVDEAHCVSQWGQDFRPSYLDIAPFLEKLPQRPVVGAFTATATGQVQADIEKLLLLQNPLRVTTGYDRPNLYFEVARPKDKDAWLRHFLAGREGQSGIIYCATRKAVEAVCGSLQERGITATRYHAGLEDEERRQNQEDFVYDRCRIMVATNAFGMGIDKSNVGFVVHYNMPKNIESYYQEAGRAGRDGAPAHCALLFSPRDVQTAKFLLANPTENEALSEEERQSVREKDLQRLSQMTAYCKTTSCLRGFLLGYFGQRAPIQCNGCGNCQGEVQSWDITLEAQKILSGVARVERKYTKSLGASLIVDMLRGSKSQRVTQLGLDTLSTYGVMADVPRARLVSYVDFLTLEGYIKQDSGEYPVLRLGPRARGVLLHGEKVAYTCVGQAEADRLAPAKTAEANREEPGGLYEALRSLRTRLAAEENVPAYIIFSNTALADMAAKQPTTLEEFRLVSGVGEVKAKKYGQAFLEGIAAWQGS
ncbi:DNA helicase RecQ [bacterium D16-76]|nr:DNA helicase RecQ [bacterium D16-76]